DPLMILAQTHLAHGAKHAVGGFAADHAGLEVEAGAGNMAAGRREDALHAGAGVRRAADNLYALIARIDDAKPEAIGIGVLFCFDDIADDKGCVVPGAIDNALDLEAERRHALCQLRGINARIEMLFQPGKGELHRAIPPTRLGISSGWKP